MLFLFLQYLFVGTVVGFFLEVMVRQAEMEFNFRERFYAIVFWPIMLMVFIYYFIKGMFEE